MTTRSAQHDRFTIERRYAAPPQRVFHAFADEKTKARWFACVSGWDVAEYSLDFRVGGREVWRGGPSGGVQHGNDTVFHDIVPDQRIVWSYRMSMDGKPISVSLTTLELHPEGSGTRMVFTEQGIYLDGYDGAADRVHGTEELLASLERELSR